ncbi:hypothetical protein Lalb_Chr25g0282771 [Lupinus albus]|uniref:Uncharacterized protein n=1 Tax=Lupinus albus TaxID=3870 RepID=A0A6A4NDX5_LUPAL|nr:hypothetical protein Lalb_Chr25g0282771 [Lupinus albus]
MIFPYIFLYVYFLITSFHVRVVNFSILEIDLLKLDDNAPNNHVPNAINMIVLSKHDIVNRSTNAKRWLPKPRTRSGNDATKLSFSVSSKASYVSCLGQSQTRCLGQSQARFSLPRSESGTTLITSVRVRKISFKC